MKRILTAKDEGEAFKVTVLKAGSGPLALKPFDAVNEDIVFDYPRWLTAEEVELEAKKLGAEIVWF